MAEYFLEPQNPLKKIDETTGDVYYIYPETTAKQVKMDNGERLSTILNENILYLGETDEATSVALVDADTLGGYSAEYFLRNAGGGGTGDVTVNLDSSETSGQASTVNADLLGGVAAENYATKQYVDNKCGMDLLWENASFSSNFAAQNITLEWSNYSQLIIVGAGSVGSRKQLYTTVIPTDHIQIDDQYLLMFPRTNNVIMHRTIKFTATNTINIGDNSSGSASNNYDVPLYIYGIK